LVAAVVAIGILAFIDLCTSLPFVYCRAIKKLKTQSDSSLLSALRSDRKEKIVEVDGTVTTQPVLQHVGISTWPGELFVFY